MAARFLYLFALLVLLGPASAWAGGGRPALVAADAARIAPLKQTAPVIGRLVARQSGVIAARIAGPVHEVLVQVGDRVAKDSIVAVIRKDALDWKKRLNDARVSEASAAVNTAKAQLALFQEELKRLERLRKSAAFSQARFDDKRHEVVRAKSALTEARAALQSATAEKKLAEIDLYNADIRAPFAGVISERHTEAGAFLGIGAKVVTLIDDRNMEIEADVPSGRIAGLAPGTPVAFRLGETTGKARVRAVVPEENPRTRTRTVRFVHDLDAAGLASNQTVYIDIPAGAPRDVLSVHKDAALRRKGETVVFVIIDGKAQIRPVKLGQAVGERFEVLDGLKAGEMVVTRGNERLRPGQPVKAGQGG